MATRIRTVKPDLFRHEGLFELEQETGLPVRLVFIGLFCCADRQGRFKWRPRELALDIMPYENVTRLSRVLDALGTRGFISKYQYEGDWYGNIPTFLRHQQINNREQGSQLPGIEEAHTVFDFKALDFGPIDNENNDLETRQPRVNHASTTRHEGKGREGKGREEDQDQDQEPREKKKPAPKPKQKPVPEPIALPNWLPKQEWAEYVEMRREKKKPVTPSIAARIIKKLEAFGLAGFSVKAALENSIVNCWTDVYEPKGETNGTGTNTGTTGARRPSLVDQVKNRNAEAQAERDRIARFQTEGAGELFDAGLGEGGIDWDGDFERVNCADGKIMGADD